MNPVIPDIEQALEEFIQAKNADGLAASSLKWYRSMLKTFTQEHAHAPAAAITANQIRAHMVTRRALYSPASYSDLSTALQAFWSWVAREYRIYNPMDNIRRVKPPAPEPRAITPADFRRMFDAAGAGTIGVRDRAMLAFLADTGARAGGVVSLTLDRLCIEQGYAIVIEKGDKPRRVVFTQAVGGLLQHWLAVRASDAQSVFLSMNDGAPLTYWGVYLALRRLKDKAGVTGRANPHSFRHGFARAYLESGGDAVTLARLMGHTNVDTTAAFYAVFAPYELAAFHERHSPLRQFLADSEPTNS